MNHFERWFGHWIIQHRWWWLFLIPVLVFFAASGGQHLTFTTNYRIFFSEENPQLKAFEAMERTYTQDDNVLFLLMPDSGDVFTNEVLSAVEELTEQAWQTPYSIRVDSITNFQHSYAEGDDLIVGDLVEGAEELFVTELDRVRKIALEEPLLVNRLVSPKGHVTAVNVTLQLPRVDETQEVPDVVAFSRKIADEFRAKYPEIKLYLSGMAFMNNAFSEASKKDMSSLVPISLGVMLLMLALLLKGLWATFAVLLVIIMSVMAAMGLGGFIGLPLSPPSVSSPTVILTMAIATSVHVLVTFYQVLAKGEDRKAAMAESLRINLQPVFLTSLTTAIGFLVMNFSDAPPFRHLGNFVALGVMASFIISLTFLPALMSILPVKAKPKPQGKALFMERFGHWVVKNNRTLLWGMALVVIALISFIPRNELNDVFVRYFDTRIEFRQHADVLDKHLGGLYRIDYSLPAGEPDGISDPDYLGKLKEFTEWLRFQPEVVHVNSISDVMRRLNKNMHSDDPEWYRVPESRELAAQYLLLYEMSLPYGLDLNNQINVDKSATRLSVTTKILSTKEVLALDDRVQQWFQVNAPQMAADGTSPTIMFANIGKRNINSMLTGTSVALVLISFILVVALRSIKIGMISLVPNLVPAAMGFGLWGLMVGQVGLSLSVVMGMTLGIVVDDTVHFLSKYLRARREQGLNAEDAVRYAFSSVGQALLVTSIVLVAGFMVLALSAFYLNAGMGLLTSIVLILALLADFLFLPALLILLDQSPSKTA